MAENSSKTIQSLKDFDSACSIERIPIIGLENALVKKNIDLYGEGLGQINEIFDKVYFQDSGFYRYLQNRPNSEVAFLYLIDHHAIKEDQLVKVICKLAQLLGGDGRLRVDLGYTTNFISGHRVEFVKPESIVERLYKTLFNLNNCCDFTPFERAVACYLDILTIHPLVDGNGRLARCLFMYSLYRDGILTAPILPIGPAIALERPAVLSACLQWQLNSNAEPLLEKIMDIVKTTIQNIRDLCNMLR